jgi:ubiquinol-cytochrome c reductase cytochrome b subunit
MDAVMKLLRWLDRQLGLARLTRSEVVDKIFPDHWTFLFGEIALYSFVVLLLTGTFLLFFFKPSGAPVTYAGSYAPLAGVPVSEAYRSVLDISFEVRGGLLVRQIHHWACNLFIAAIILHLSRLFFTGAYRRPRQLNWLFGATLLILAITNGFTGYSIGDDLLSGTGLRIAFSSALSLPLVGPFLSFLIFGGNVPNPAVIPRLYAIHIFLVPAAIVGVLAIHMGILVRQKHTNYPGPGRDDRTIVGTRLWPAYAPKSISLFLFVAGILAGLGAFCQINPVWLYGPYFPAAATSAAHPDWYFSWLEGALRLMPGWRILIGRFLVPQPFLSAVLVSLLSFAALYLWPFAAGKATHDRDVHHVLLQPRRHPVRTAIGTAVIAFFVCLTMAGFDDMLALVFAGEVSVVRSILRGLVVVLPLLAAGTAYLAARRLSRPERPSPPRPGSPGGAGSAKGSVAEKGPPSSA